MHPNEFHISRKSCAQLLREPSVREAKYSFCAQKLLRETLFMPVLCFTGIKIYILDYQVFDVIWLCKALFLSVKIANSLIFKVI